MKKNNSVEESANAIRRLWEKHGIQKPMRLLGFCLSVLPIPIIQEAGQVLDRYLSDKELKKELSKIWNEIESINSAVASTQTLEESIIEIAQTVSNNEKLREKCERLSSALANNDTSFTVDSEGDSYQELISLTVKSAEVLISAKNNSTNKIENSKIHSRKTRLSASNGSKNYVHGTHFIDGDSAVEMHHMATHGEIEVSGCGIGFGSTDSALSFSFPPNTLTAICPLCKLDLIMEAHLLEGLTTVECPHCKKSLPFDMPPRENL